METSWEIEFTGKKNRIISIFNNKTDDMFNISVNLEHDNLKRIVNCLKDGSQCEIECEHITFIISKYHIVIKYFDIPVEFKAVLSIDTYKDVLIKGFSS